VRRKKLLLVDDSETVLMLERLILQGDYDIITATDGRTAIARALADRPDLIVLDLVMPEMDGVEVCKALRSRPETKRTPIVMVTSEAGWESMKAGYTGGCSAYLTKPVHGPRLLAKIKRFLTLAGDQR
jgi:CheY-like chemotaxis protein